jgi:hypothetical protein
MDDLIRDLQSMDNSMRDSQNVNDFEMYLKKIGIECRKIRKDKKIKVREIAEIAGCTIDSIFKFERGEIASLRIYYTYKKIESEGIT